MNFSFRGLNDDCAASPTEIVRCPFLRNINQPTNFSFSSAMPVSMPVRGAKGPIFEDGPNFDMAFRLFHGRDGVVPLSERSFTHVEKVESDPAPLQFNPLAAKAATISLSSFGLGGPFGFDAVSRKWNNQSGKPKITKESFSKGRKSKHEALSNEWLQSGSCPIAKSYRAVGKVLPLVAKALQPPLGMTSKCLPAIVTARAILSKTAFAKNLRPLPLPAKVLDIGFLGLAANVSLGIWQEHTEKFSPWFTAHAAVPFIGILRKAVLMPRTAMAFTIAASILGQVIGSRAERYRLKSVAGKNSALLGASSLGAGNELQVIAVNGSHCGKHVGWEPAPLQLAIPLTSADVFG